MCLITPGVPPASHVPCASEEGCKSNAAATPEPSGGRRAASALVLQPAHTTITFQVLLPMHKVKSLAIMHPQLAYCVVQFVDKDPALAVPVVNGELPPAPAGHVGLTSRAGAPRRASARSNRTPCTRTARLSLLVTSATDTVPLFPALLRYWPKLKSPKQVMFLNELEAVIEVTNGPEFKEVRCAAPAPFAGPRCRRKARRQSQGPATSWLTLCASFCVFACLLHGGAPRWRWPQVAAGIVRQIAAGINTLHFQVAERCLYLWNNDHLQELVKPMAEDLIPLIFPALHKHSQSHWNRNTLGLSFSVLNGLSDRHPAIIERCTEQLPTSAKLSSETRMRLDMAWARLEQEAQRNPVAREVGGLIHPTGPAASRHPVTDGLSEAKVLRDIPGPMDHKMLSKTKMRRKSFLPRDEYVIANCTRGLALWPLAYSAVGANHAHAWSHRTVPPGGPPVVSTHCPLTLTTASPSVRCAGRWQQHCSSTMSIPLASRRRQQSDDGLKSFNARVASRAQLLCLPCCLLTNRGHPHSTTVASTVSEAIELCRKLQ